MRSRVAYFTARILTMSVPKPTITTVTTTLSTSSTLVASPSKMSSPSITSSGGRNIYEAANSQLAEKVPQVITQEELDSFFKACKEDNCTTEGHARDHLLKIQSENKHHGKLHSFFECLNRLFAPLVFFKGALDILCQSHSAFCLVWGSVRALMEVSETTRDETIGTTHHHRLFSFLFASRPVPYSALFIPGGCSDSPAFALGTLLCMHLPTNSHTCVDRSAGRSSSRHHQPRNSGSSQLLCSIARV